MSASSSAPSLNVLSPASGGNGSAGESHDPPEASVKNLIDSANTLLQSLHKSIDSRKESRRYSRILHGRNYQESYSRGDELLNDTEDRLGLDAGVSTVRESLFDPPALLNQKIFAESATQVSDESSQKLLTELDAMKANITALEHKVRALMSKIKSLETIGSNSNIQVGSAHLVNFDEAFKTNNKTLEYMISKTSTKIKGDLMAFSSSKISEGLRELQEFKDEVRCDISSLRDAVTDLLHVQVGSIKGTLKSLTEASKRRDAVWEGELNWLKAKITALEDGGLPDGTGQEKLEVFSGAELFRQPGFRSSIEPSAPLVSTIVWRIERASEFFSVAGGDAIASPPFCLGGVPKMRLLWFPQGVDHEGRGWCGLMVMAPRGSRLLFRLSVPSISPSLLEGRQNFQNFDVEFGRKPVGVTKFMRSNVLYQHGKKVRFFLAQEHGGQGFLSFFVDLLNYEGELLGGNNPRSTVIVQGIAQEEVESILPDRRFQKDEWEGEKGEEE